MKFQRILQVRAVEESYGVYSEHLVYGTLTLGLIEPTYGEPIDLVVQHVPPFHWRVGMGGEWYAQGYAGDEAQAQHLMETVAKSLGIVGFCWGGGEVVVVHDDE